MKIIVDDNIPFINGLLEPFGEVVYKPGRLIAPADVADADALFVRTRTRCDADLLGGSRCRFVATATIGKDHMDLPWCREHGIETVNAPGCNAPGVAQYVFAAIGKVFPRVKGLTIGIVGVGHVGGIVERWARSMGMNVMLCDPPRALAEGPEGFSDLSAVAARADIITFHTPLSRRGDFPSYHLGDARFFASLRRYPLVINAARGGVMDEAAALRTPNVRALAIDCWEGEPVIDRELLDRALVATPHIAGYSRQGKIRATRMVLDAFSRHFGLPEIAMAETCAATAPETMTMERIRASYDIDADTALLRAAPADFESLRDNYCFRDEA